MSTKHRVDVWTFKCEYGFDKIVSWLQDNYSKFMLTWLIPKNNNFVDTVVGINVVNETLNILNNNTPRFKKYTVSHEQCDTETCQIVAYAITVNNTTYSIWVEKIKYFTTNRTSIEVYQFIKHIPGGSEYTSIHDDELIVDKMLSSITP